MPVAASLGSTPLTETVPGATPEQAAGADIFATLIGALGNSMMPNPGQQAAPALAAAAAEPADAAAPGDPEAAALVSLLAVARSLPPIPAAPGSVGTDPEVCPVRDDATETADAEEPTSPLLALACAIPAPPIQAKVAAALGQGTKTAKEALPAAPAQVAVPTQVAAPGPQAVVPGRVAEAIRALVAGHERPAPLQPSMRPADPAEAARPVEAAAPSAAKSLPPLLDVQPPGTAALDLLSAGVLTAPAEAAPQMEVAELMVEHQLDMAQDGEWLDNLARDIARAAGSEASTLRFRLNPENLGSIRVELTPDRGGTAVRLTADTEAARAIIADAQPKLVAEARAQGLRISETHVDLGGHHGSGDPKRQNEAFHEPQVRTARLLREEPGESDQGVGKPTRARSERYA